MAILDQGLEASFISESAVQKLRLNRRFANVEVGCILDMSEFSHHTVAFQLNSPRSDENFRVDVNAYVLQGFTRYRPKRIDMSHYLEFADWEMVDVDIELFDRVDFLIGVDLLPMIFTDQVKFSRDLH